MKFVWGFPPRLLQPRMLSSLCQFFSGAGVQSCFVLALFSSSALIGIARSGLSFPEPVGIWWPFTVPFIPLFVFFSCLFVSLLLPDSWAVSSSTSCATCSDVLILTLRCGQGLGTPLPSLAGRRVSGPREAFSFPGLPCLSVSAFLLFIGLLFVGFLQTIFGPVLLTSLRQLAVFSVTSDFFSLLLLVAWDLGSVPVIDLLCVVPSGTFSPSSLPLGLF